MRKLLLLNVALPFFALAPAYGATLRPNATLDGDKVRLSDLFDDAGAQADRVLGPGPAPGGRIVVEAAQLAAIARQFDVDWRPAGDADRAVLDRPGRPLPREAVLDALRGALAKGGAPGSFEIDLPGFSPPLVGAEGQPKVNVEQVDYEASSGRFNALVSVTCQGMAPMRLRLSGTAQAMVDVPVPTRRLLAGTVLQPGDVTMGQVRANLIQTDVVRRPRDAVGKELRHAAFPGQALAVAELIEPAVVQRNERVMMALDVGGLTVAATGQAMQQGALGEQIAVLNPVSHAVVMAEVTGPGRVRVAPGSLPVTPSQKQAAGSQLAWR